jgi:hypothetical protein
MQRETFVQFFFIKSAQVSAFQHLLALQDQRKEQQQHKEWQVQHKEWQMYS